MPITFGNSGSTYLIKDVTGRPEMKQHLENLGFVAGEPVKIISKISGSLIIDIKGTRIALDQHLASKIHI